jgi:AcrR family transcriptional regulator
MQEATRRRIVEAAVELHSQLGPARTSIAQIAQKAGVQRHTYYAHFPDERSLLDACSGLSLERDPLPDVDHWLSIAAGGARARFALDQLYRWFGRNAELVASVLRDAQVHEPTRETVAARWAPTFERAAEIIAEEFGEDSLALARVAVDFACWRALEATNPPRGAAAIMSDAIIRAAAGQRA